MRVGVVYCSVCFGNYDKILPSDQVIVNPLISLHYDHGILYTCEDANVTNVFAHGKMGTEAG